MCCYSSMKLPAWDCGFVKLKVCENNWIWEGLWGFSEWIVEGWMVLGGREIGMTMGLTERVIRGIGMWSAWMMDVFRKGRCHMWKLVEGGGAGSLWLREILSELVGMAIAEQVLWIGGVGECWSMRRQLVYYSSPLVRDAWGREREISWLSKWTKKAHAN